MLRCFPCSPSSVIKLQDLKILRQQFTNCIWLGDHYTTSTSNHYGTIHTTSHDCISHPIVDVGAALEWIYALISVSSGYGQQNTHTHAIETLI